MASAKTFRSRAGTALTLEVYDYALWTLSSIMNEKQNVFVKDIRSRVQRLKASLSYFRDSLTESQKEMVQQLYFHSAHFHQLAKECSSDADPDFPSYGYSRFARDLAKDTFDWQFILDESDEDVAALYNEIER